MPSLIAEAGSLDWKEIREWVQLGFVIVGGVLAISAFWQNMRQRRLENSLKLVTLFKENLSPGDLAHWVDLFRSSSELAGAPMGHYAYEGGGYRPMSDYFSEGSGDDNAISRMAKNLEIICHELCRGTADVRFVYYELGQLLTTMHGWLRDIDKDCGDNTLLGHFHPSIKKVCEKHRRDFEAWPTRVYAYVE